VLTEFRMAVRTIVRCPTSHVGVITSLAIGIGAATAIFSVIDATMLRSTPFPNSERLAEIWSQDTVLDYSIPSVPGTALPEWEKSGLFDALAPFRRRQVLVVVGEEPRMLSAVEATDALLPLLGAEPIAGRRLQRADLEPAAPDVALISEELWRSEFGGRRGAVGEVVSVDGRTPTIVGVLPGSLRYPAGVVSVWLPLRPPSASAAARPPSYTVLALLSPALTREVAAQQVKAVAGRITAGGLATIPSAQLRYLNDALINADVRRAMLVLAGAVACLLLVACTNAANLQLARLQDRDREITIRAALGASRMSLVRLMLTESILVAVVGGLLGTLAAYWGVGALIAITPRELSVFSYREIGVDLRGLSFALLLSVGSGIVVALVPAIRSSRRGARLAPGERSSTPPRLARSSRGWLIVAETAFSMMLLIGAGLFLRSFTSLAGSNPGYEADHILTVELTAPRARYNTAAAREA